MDRKTHKEITIEKIKKKYPRLKFSDDEINNWYTTSNMSRDGLENNYIFKTEERAKDFFTKLSIQYYVIRMSNLYENIEAHLPITKLFFNEVYNHLSKILVKNNNDITHQTLPASILFFVSERDDKTKYLETKPIIAKTFNFDTFDEMTENIKYKNGTVSLYCSMLNEYENEKNFHIRMAFVNRKNLLKI